MDRNWKLSMTEYETQINYSLLYLIWRINFSSARGKSNKDRLSNIYSKKAGNWWVENGTQNICVTLSTSSMSSARSSLQKTTSTSSGINPHLTKVIYYCRTWTTKICTEWAWKCASITGISSHHEDFDMPRQEEKLNRKSVGRLLKLFSNRHIKQASLLYTNLMTESDHNNININFKYGKHVILKTKNE